MSVNPTSSPKFRAPLDIKFVGSVDGRFVLPDRDAVTGGNAVQVCRTQSITPTELIVASFVPAIVGERFASTFNRLGSINGKVVRIVSGGFAVAVQSSAIEQQSLADTINWLKKRHARQAEDLRSAPRIRARGEPCIVRYLDTEWEVNLFDISISGASVTATKRPPINSEVRIGRIDARVVRHTEGRFGVVFNSVQLLSTLLAELTLRQSRPVSA